MHSCRHKGKHTESAWWTGWKCHCLKKRHKHTHTHTLMHAHSQRAAGDETDTGAAVTNIKLVTVLWELKRLCHPRRYMYIYKHLAYLCVCIVDTFSNVFFPYAERLQ